VLNKFELKYGRCRNLQKWRKQKITELIYFPRGLYVSDTKRCPEQLMSLGQNSDPVTDQFEGGRFSNIIFGVCCQLFCVRVYFVCIFAIIFQFLGHNPNQFNFLLL